MVLASWVTNSLREFGLNENLRPKRFQPVWKEVCQLVCTLGDWPLFRRRFRDYKEEPVQRWMEEILWAWGASSAETMGTGSAGSVDWNVRFTFLVFLVHTYLNFSDVLGFKSFLTICVVGLVVWISQLSLYTWRFWISLSLSMLVFLIELPTPEDSNFLLVVLCSCVETYPY